MYHSEVAKRHALVAQLDRVSDYESEGLGFESLRAHHNKNERRSAFVFVMCKTVRVMTLRARRQTKRKLHMIGFEEFPV